MWNYPSPWKHQGDGADGNACCDPTEAHYAMPQEIQDFTNLLDLPSLNPGDNPGVSSWLRGAVVVAVVTAGVVAGVGVAHAMVGRRRKVDPVLSRAAEETIRSLGVETDLMTLTDAAYHSARPDCPKRLDPGDPTQADCIRSWLLLRDLVAAELPAPTMPQPTPQSGLSNTGPAADMRGWLESLTQQQHNELREGIGAKHYDPIILASGKGDDQAVVKSVRALKVDIEELASSDPISAWRQYRGLKSSLGTKLDDLLRLAQQYEAGP